MQSVVFANNETISVFPKATLFDDAPVQVPDLYWEPEPFVPVLDVRARYIDYENGKDTSEGSRDKPWKHHPWDPNAKGRAAAARGIRTYYFKKGVTYRGHLIARESGQQDDPIHLTVDQGWGDGEAVLAGSSAITGGWQKCSEDEATILPSSSRDRTWCQRIGAVEPPRALWEVKGRDVTRIPIARTPNWRVSFPYDPRYEWQELTDVVALVEVSLSSTKGFRVNDEIWPARLAQSGRGTNGAAKGRYRVIEVRNGVLRIEGSGWKKWGLRKGTNVTNGVVTRKIGRISNAHETEWRLIDKSGFSFNSESELKGAVIWVERSTMPMPVAAEVTAFDGEEGSITTNLHVSPGSGPRKHSRYYLEGAAAFLDSQGEYYFKSTYGNAGTLYLRLPDDRNPNHSLIEAAGRPIILEMRDQSHIHVSGLAFRFTNSLRPGTRAARHAALHASAIQIRGTISDIRIHHCKFSNLAAGIVAYPEQGRQSDHLDNLELTDNTFADIDGQGIALGNGRDVFMYKDSSSRLVHVLINRNKLDRTGLYALGHWGLGSLGNAVEVNGGEVVEVSGNHVNYSGGSGILVFLGSAYSRGEISRPLLRNLIHHNKITNTLLRVQDQGGISSWMGGPTFIYSNISGNPVGYKHIKSTGDRKNPQFRHGSYGVGIYLDGQYKGYVFNNIVWGFNNDSKQRYYNSAAFNEAMGFMNTVFHNTLFNYTVGLHKGMHQHNRCYYVGNLLIGMRQKFIQQEVANSAIEYDSLAFQKNVFSGEVEKFGQLGRGNGSVHSTFDDWVTSLRGKEPIEYETGKHTTSRVVRDPKSFDFRPTADSPAIDAGAKVFVPWPLYRVVGEWHFLRSRSNPEVVNGENFNMNKEWVNRDMFQDIPRNDLACVDVNVQDYRRGILEDWTNGALYLDGTNSFCFLRNSDISKGYKWAGGRAGGAGNIGGEDRDTVDMIKNNFLLEAVLELKSQPLQEKGAWPVVSKVGERGYVLEIDEEGMVRLSLQFGSHSASRTGSVPVNDGNWHHVVAEVDRHNPRGISLYIDGRLANGKWAGEMEPLSSLSNTGDFRVGRFGERYFSGKIDFLRISKGTLSDAETSIEELYGWQFNGPFLDDFSGNPVAGSSRDAGAVELNRN